jgi:catechol 2,3-dioxygenase-like lactoylglutathione lyase family enzyme
MTGMPVIGGMLDHTGIVVTDLAKARRFYDAIGRTLGLKTADNGDNAFLLGKSINEYPYLWIGTLIPSYWVQGSRPGINQMHVAFAARDREMVDAFHEAALRSGGRDNGAPGPREGVKGYYGAFVLDPDGNNIEACFREA